MLNDADMYAAIENHENTHELEIAAREKYDGQPDGMDDYTPGDFGPQVDSYRYGRWYDDPR